jgi:adenylate cyclase, class 2
MKFEVEQKYRVEDRVELVRRLTELGATPGPTEVQSDVYFAHPSRDFAQSDEALRIRTVGTRSFVAYKGPKVDATTKTRRELELPLAGSDADGTQLAELLGALGFTKVAVVRKSRHSFALDQEGRKVNLSLDDVDGVGTYLELELIADQAGLDDARRVIEMLAARLPLATAERRSYLELLLGR